MKARRVTQKMLDEAAKLQKTVWRYSLTCSGCGKDVAEAVEVGDDSVDSASYATLCLQCVIDAVETFEDGGER